MRRFALALLGCAACSPGAFEDRRDQAWADSNGAPEAADVGDFGVVVTSVATGRAGLHIVVAGADPLTLSTLSYDDTYDLTTEGREVSGVTASQGEAPTVVAAPFNVAGADGLVAVGGLGTLNQILLFDANTGLDGPSPRAILDAESCGSGLENIGHAMTFAKTDLGDPDIPELVAIAGSELLVFPDLDLDATSPTCYRCTVQGGGVGLALAAASLGFADGEGIVLTDTGDSFGGIVLFRGSNVKYHHDQGADCFTAQTAQAAGFRSQGNEPDVGRVMALGDADTIDDREFALAAPSSGMVYIIPNAGTSGPGGPTRILEPAPGASGEFGASLVFGDLDGDDIDELIVGDPGASPEGVTGAGAVYVYADSDGTLELVATLYDSTPEPDQRFGRSVAIGELVVGGDDRDQLIVGAAGEVFTYFRALPTGTDPRFE